jgi:hypothetical protein
MPHTALLDHAAPASLAALAEQLRDGPLQQLIELQTRATQLADRLATDPGSRVEDIEGLLRLSLSAMEQFHAFTREFAAVLREVADVHGSSH